MKKTNIIKVLRLLNLHLKNMIATQPLMKEEYTYLLELNKDMLREIRQTQSSDMSELIDEEALLKIIEVILLPYGADFSIRYIKERKNQITYI
tara:strand:+ start:550 stop:828 length:279 start_codon:yes stop_codon:yes gene_type:complete